jgi:hypothetical protein
MGTSIDVINDISTVMSGSVYLGLCNTFSIILLSEVIKVMARVFTK